MAKKAFFQQPTKAQILKGKFVNFEEVGDYKNIPQLLGTDNYTIIPSRIPVNLDYPEKKDYAKIFMKHGPEVRPMRLRSLPSALEINMFPFQLRWLAFDRLASQKNLPIFCCYSEKPWGLDERTRKIPLTSCIGGERLFAFSHQSPEERISVRPYDDARRVELDGASILVKVPSRTEGIGPYEMLFNSVPVVNNDEKYAIGRMLETDHVCGDKRFKIRYTYKKSRASSKAVNFCAHEIAGYLEIIHYFFNENNKTPLEMCLFAIPTQDTVNYYLAFERNVLVKDKMCDSKDLLRKPNIADLELALWQRVKDMKNEKSFYSRKSRDGNVSDYKWM